MTRIFATLQNLTTVVPQAVGEMLDSVQAEEESTSSVASSEPEPDSTADSSSTLLRKTVLNAAVEHLASAPEPGLAEPFSSPTSRPLQQPQPYVVRPSPDEQHRASFVPYEPVVSTAPDAPRGSGVPERQYSQPQATPAPRRKTDTTPSPTRRSAVVGNARLPENARPASLPTERLATLLADEEQTMFSTTTTPEFVRDPPRVKTVLSQPDTVKKEGRGEKPGTSLLSLTQKLLKEAGEETPSAARTTDDPRFLSRQEPGESRGEGSVLGRGGHNIKQPTPKETPKDEIRLHAEENQPAAPQWHPFAASSSEQRQAFTPGWLSVAVVVLLATILVILLQILNL